jgi:hypothetical protein
MSCTTLSEEEVDWIVGRLFDKDPPTAWPTDLPLHYSNKTPPPSVRATIFSDHHSILLLTYPFGL